MAEIKILSVISKLRPKVKRGRTIELDDIADETARYTGMDRGGARDFAYKFAQSLSTASTPGWTTRVTPSVGWNCTPRTRW